MSVITLSLSPIILSETKQVVRQPYRDELARSTDFEEKFDYFTLIYDLFWSADNTEIIGIGPPFHFPRSGSSFPQFIALPSGAICAVRHDRPERPLNGRSRFRIGAPAGTTGFDVAFADQRWIVPVQPNISHLMRGRRGLVALTRNNLSPWVVDWITYHHRQHGFEAFLLFDNGSSDPDADALARDIDIHCPSVLCIIVQAPFPFGPTSERTIGGPRDSNFLQAALYEIALERVFRHAAVLANFDIDELLVERTPHAFEALIADPKFESNLLPRFNVFGAPPASGRAKRHSDDDQMSFKHALLPKWVANPAAVRRNDQLHVHAVVGHRKRPVEREALYLAHFFALARDQRPRWNGEARGEAPAEIGHIRQNRSLRRVLNRCFPDPEAAPAWSPLMLDQADLLKRRAALAHQSGQHEVALALLDRGALVAPDHYPSLALRHTVLLALGRDSDAALLRPRLDRASLPRFYEVMAAYHTSRNELAEAAEWRTRSSRIFAAASLRSQP